MLENNRDASCQVLVWKLDVAGLRESEPFLEDLEYSLVLEGRQLSFDLDFGTRFCPCLGAQCLIPRNRR